MGNDTKILAAVALVGAVLTVMGTVPLPAAVDNYSSYVEWLDNPTTANITKGIGLVLMSGAVLFWAFRRRRARTPEAAMPGLALIRFADGKGRITGGRLDGNVVIGPGAALLSGVRAVEQTSLVGNYVTTSVERPVPDLPISDLFFHIDPSILANPHRGPEQDVAADILDRLATGQLHAWGRPSGQNNTLGPIPAEFWAHARWTFAWFYDDSQRQVHAERSDGVLSGYMAVTFNSAEALRIWPVSKKVVWPNFVAWDKVDPLEVYQAACLWADEEPILPMSDVSAAVYRRLNEKYLQHQLNVSIGETVREAVEEAIESTNYQKVNPHGKVTRADLVRIATEWGERPKFLYARERV